MWDFSAVAGSAYLRCKSPLNVRNCRWKTYNTFEGGLSPYNQASVGDFLRTRVLTSLADMALEGGCNLMAVKGFRGQRGKRRTEKRQSALRPLVAAIFGARG